MSKKKKKKILRLHRSQKFVCMYFRLLFFFFSSLKAVHLAVAFIGQKPTLRENCY